VNVLAGSLVYRAAMPVWRWLLAACRASLVGRFFLAVVGVVTRVASDSGSLGTRRAGSRPLESTGHPVALLVIARPYLWLRRVVGGGPVGTVARAGWSQLAESCLARGRWVRVLGAGFFALGCGRVALLLARGITTVDNTGIPLAAPGARYVAPSLVLIVGGLMLLAGARLLPAVPISLTGRAIGFVAGGPLRFASADRESDDSTQAQRWLACLVTFLAAVAGAAGGLTAGQGPEKLLLLVFAICAVVLFLVRPEALLVVVAVFPWLDWAARRVLGGAGPLWDETLLVVSVLLLLWCVVVLRRWELWTLPITLPLLLAFAAALGSVAVNDVPGDVGFYALRMLFEPMLFYFLGFLFPKDRRWVRATIIVFVAVSTSLALHGLYQYVTHAPMPARWVDASETDIGTRAYSIIMNPNGLAAFLLMGALVSMSLALARVSRLAPRLLWALACVVQLGGIAVTFSRGAWIGLAAGVLVLVIMAYRRYLVVIVGAAVLAWFFAPRAFVDRLTFAFSSAYITKSSQAGRLYVWRMALDYAAAHPWLGIGLGTFGGTSAITFGYGRLWVDNFYLQLAAEGGLLLLAFFLWILLRAIKGLVKGHGATDGFRRALAAGMIAAFVAVAVANVTASVWETLTVGVGFWFLTGLVTSATLHERAVPGEEGA
jgi:O-antigen ligase